MLYQQDKIVPIKNEISDFTTSKWVGEEFAFELLVYSGKHAKIVQKIETNIFPFIPDRLLKTHALLENSALSQIFHYFSKEQIERVYAFYRDDTPSPPQKKNLCARVLFRQLKFMSNFVYFFQKMYVETVRHFWNGIIACVKF